MRVPEYPEIAERIIPWFAEHQRDLPWRRESWQRRYGAWGQLVAEFMLQQTQVDRVIPKLHAWLERWPTPTALASDSVAEAIRMWDRLGYPRRAMWLHRAAQEIVERFDGEVPSSVDDLLSLQGVGDYTARAVAAFAFGHRHPVVDTNTRRVLARAALGLSNAGAPHAQNDQALMESVLPEDVHDAAMVNAGMMELGAIICTAKKPLCDSCPLLDCCEWARSGFVENAPKPRAKQKTFEGSDRQARGIIMAALREQHEHSDGSSSTAELLSLIADADQASRALRSLERDGLIEHHPHDSWSLPQA